MSSPVETMPERAVMAQYSPLPVQRWTGASYHELADNLAEELPVALLYNGIPYAVMLASPADLEDFALGFSLSEQIIGSAGELLELKQLVHDDGIELHLRIPAWRATHLQERTRNIAGCSGCGLCGATSLEEVMKHLPAVPEAGPVCVEVLHRAVCAVTEHQHLNRVTGSVHAAAWCSDTGEILVLREDIGRHNALDKLIGALHSSNTNWRDGFLLVTSRASYEMVQKAIQAGIGLMVAISAPTAMAVRIASQYGLGLVGFARDNTHVVYADPHTLIRNTVNHED